MLIHHSINSGQLEDTYFANAMKADNLRFLVLIEHPRFNSNSSRRLITSFDVISLIRRESAVAFFLLHTCCISKRIASRYALTVLADMLRTSVRYSHKNRRIQYPAYSDLFFGPISVFIKEFVSFFIDIVRHSKIYGCMRDIIMPKISRQVAKASLNIFAFTIPNS